MVLVLVAAECTSHFGALTLWVVKVKVKVVDLYCTSTRNISKALRYSTHCQWITQFFYLHTLLLSASGMSYT